MAVVRRAPEAIFGASDGAFTGLGLILGLVSGATVAGLVRVAFPAAAAGTMSMAVGVLQSDDDKGWADAAVMGVAWAVACVAPVLAAIWLAGPALWLLVAVWLAGLGVAITRARETSEGRRAGWRSYLRTFAGMVAVAVPTVAVAVLFP